MAEDDEGAVSSIAAWLDDLNRTERRQAIVTAPSDEPLQWPDRRTRLVRLDVAILSFHLFALRVGVRSVPGLLRQRASKVISAFARGLAKGIAVQLFGQVVSRILAPLKLIWTLWTSNTAQLEYENAVRRSAIQTKRELYLLKLRQLPKTTRRSERVLTRHFIPRQRRPNGHAKRKRHPSHT